MIFLDLDDFKAVNDSLGHGAGDELLVALAGRLRMSVREADTPARMGGDEFAVLLEDAPSVEAARDSAKRVLEALRLPVRLHDRDVAVRASAGIAMYSTPDQTAEELLRNADISMYSAKAQGKDRLVVYESSVHDAAIGRLQLRTDLQLALERREFALVYQPLVDLETSEILGVEALLRWRHPRRGLIGPAEFVPIAEESGLITAIGRWVLEEACRQAGTWQGAPNGRGFDLSVNLSGRQIEDRPRPASLILPADPFALPLEIELTRLGETDLGDPQPCGLGFGTEAEPSEFGVEPPQPLDGQVQAPDPARIGRPRALAGAPRLVGGGR